MSTKIEQDQETFTIESLDFDHETPCDYSDNRKDRSCDKPAEWVITFSCCGEKIMFCQEHFDFLLELCQMIDGFLCNQCGEVTVPAAKMLLSADRIK